MSHDLTTGPCRFCSANNHNWLEWGNGTLHTHECRNMLMAECHEKIKLLVDQRDAALRLAAERLALLREFEWIQGQCRVCYEVRSIDPFDMGYAEKPQHLDSCRLAAAIKDAP